MRRQQPKQHQKQQIKRGTGKVADKTTIITVTTTTTTEEARKIVEEVSAEAEEIAIVTTAENNGLMELQYLESVCKEFCRQLLSLIQKYITNLNTALKQVDVRNSGE